MQKKANTFPKGHNRLRQEKAAGEMNPSIIDAGKQFCAGEKSGNAFGFLVGGGGRQKDGR